MNRICPPCDGLCSQGRPCPYRPQFLRDVRPDRSRSDAFWLGVFALLPIAMLGRFLYFVNWAMGGWK